MPKHDEFLDSKTLIHKKEGLQVVHQDRRRNCYIPLYRSIKPLRVLLALSREQVKAGGGWGKCSNVNIVEEQKIFSNHVLEELAI